jgi:exonuclease SbcC
MRPRVLTVTAFGPYAGTERIDFTPFFERGVMLIDGPTGAGKTAILDAISYALFGVVPGARDQARTELRSAWADPHAHCSVELELELGGRILRATRSPEQVRPKKRGSGTTKHHPEASLVEVIDGREVPLCASRLGDVDGKIHELLGLTAEQWKQVVILPQGEFRRFLLATSSEKEGLLEQLFATRELRDVADRLHAAQMDLERRAAEAERSTG